MNIGFIGLGRMGSAMAKNLVMAGQDVTVFNRSPGRSRALVQLGAHEATDIAGACRGPRSGHPLLGPLGVLAVWTGGGGVSVPIYQRSSSADRGSSRVALFARRDCPARPLASRRERLSTAEQQLRALLQLVYQRYQPKCSGRTTVATAISDTRRPVSPLTDPADSALRSTSRTHIPIVSAEAAFTGQVKVNHQVQSGGEQL